MKIFWYFNLIFPSFSYNFFLKKKNFFLLNVRSYKSIINFRPCVWGNCNWKKNWIGKKQIIFFSKNSNMFIEPSKDFLLFWMNNIFDHPHPKKCCEKRKSMKLWKGIFNSIYGWFMGKAIKIIFGWTLNITKLWVFPSFFW